MPDQFAPQDGAFDWEEKYRRDNARDVQWLWEEPGGQPESFEAWQKRREAEERSLREPEVRETDGT